MHAMTDTVARSIQVTRCAVSESQRNCASGRVGLPPRSDRRGGGAGAPEGSAQILGGISPPAGAGFEPFTSLLTTPRQLPARV